MPTKPTRKRRPATKFTAKVTVRPIKLSELSTAERLLIESSLRGDGGYTDAVVRKPRGLKVKIAAGAMQTLQTIPAKDLDNILQAIVDYASAERRRKLTKPKLGRKVRK